MSQPDQPVVATGSHPAPATAVDAPTGPMHPWHPLLGHWVVRLAGFVGTTVLVAVLVGRVGSALGWSRYVAGALQETISTLAGYLVMVRLLERRALTELAPRRLGGLLGGILLGAGTCVVVFAICWATGLRTVEGTRPDAPLLVPMLLYGVAAGVGEEILFRGLLFGWLQRRFGLWVATGVSALVFGLLHLTNPGATWWGAVAIALEAGVFYGLLYAATGSLWWVMGAHAAWNVVQGPVLGSAISGATTNGDGWLVSQPAGPELLSGGGFGLEASLVSVVVYFLLSAWLVRRLRRRAAPHTLTA